MLLASPDKAETMDSLTKHPLLQDVRTSRIEEDVEYEAGSSSLEGQQSDVPRYSEWLGGSGAQPSSAQLKDTFTQPHSKSYG